MADKGYDSERIREQVDAKGMDSVIPRKRNSKIGNICFGRGLYRYRHLVENAFARLKPYRAIATRYDKLKRNYESMVALGFVRKVGSQATVDARDAYHRSKATG